MALKEILVHLDHNRRSQTRLDLAIALAAKHQAHLSGFYASLDFSYSLQDGIEDFTAGQLQEYFHRETELAGISADWLDSSSVGSLTEVVVNRVILQAYYADLVIVGQTDESAGNLGTPADFPEQIAIACGRPVLVVPRRGEFPSVGERVMVAWRGGRASSRALKDAIPFLRQARKVDVMIANPSNSFQQDAENLCTYLSRNGIDATWSRISAEEMSTGNLLLNQACDLGADLAVLGILPRRRLGKFVLGPVGRHFLDHMTLPVLISC